MNMIFAELIMAVFGVPVNFTASLQHGWKLGKPFCDVHGFALTLESKSFSIILINKNNSRLTIENKTDCYYLPNISVMINHSYLCGFE